MKGVKHYTFYSYIPDSFKKVKGFIYIGLVGGRNVDDYNFIKSFFLEVIDRLGVDLSKVIIVSGGAKGVDNYTKEIAYDYKLTLIEIKPEWNKYGKSAGIIRNKSIVEISDIIIAIPDTYSVGTYRTINIAKQKGVPIYIKKYNIT